MIALNSSRLPQMAGHVFIAVLGYVGGVLGRVVRWIFARYMRAPLATTATLVLVILSALAASNALFFQTGRHPAPYFAPHPDVPVAVAIQQNASVVLPEPRPVIPGSYEATGSVYAMTGSALPDTPVGNSDAFAVQKKLTELGLFKGKVDGFYGPMTAAAIRAFEESHGMRPIGALTRPIIDAILNAEAVSVPTTPQFQFQLVSAAPESGEQQEATALQGDQDIARLPPILPADNTVDNVDAATAQTLDALVAALEDTGAASGQDDPDFTDMASAAPASNPRLISQIQRGLASLGFYHGPIDGLPGDATARAIREFENFYSFRVTGRVNPDLVDLLQQAGAMLW